LTQEFIDGTPNCTAYNLKFIGPLNKISSIYFRSGQPADNRPTSHFVIFLGGQPADNRPKKADNRRTTAYNRRSPKGVQPGQPL